MPDPTTEDLLDLLQIIADRLDVIEQRQRVDSKLLRRLAAAASPAAQALQGHRDDRRAERRALKTWTSADEPPRPFVPGPALRRRDGSG